MRALALFVSLLLSSSLLAQGLDKSFAPPSGSGGFDPNAVLGAPPPPPKAPADPTGSLIFDALPPPPPPKIWFGSTEFGMNGSQGNTDVLNIRFGSNAKRETPSNVFQASFLYTLSQQDGELTSNKALFSSIDEFKWGDSPWSPFVSNAIEYDDFRAYDFRIAGHAGCSYRFIQNEWTLLKGRLGAGASAEFSSVDDVPMQWIPEGLVGFDFEHRFTDRQRFVSSGNYYPDVVDISQFRIRVRAAYEILIDPDTNLTLRLGVQDRFDSKPGPNTKQNDVDYFVAMMIQF